MRNFIICIILCALNTGLYSYAAGLELTDVIKQAREIEMKKQLAVRNTVKEIKTSQAKEQSAVEKITAQEIDKETLNTEK